MYKKYDNEDASSGGLIGLIMLIFFGGLIFAACGYISIDIINLANDQMLTGKPISQDSFNTIWVIVTGAMSAPMLYLLYWGIDHLLNAFKEYPGEA